MSAGGSDVSAVGFVGLGKMGWPMAARLAAAGHSLTVFDQRHEQAVRFVAEHPSRTSASLRELAASSEVVITMLPDGAAVRAVVAGDGASDDRLLDGLADGATVIDMSSSAPQGTRTLGELLAARGVTLLDAPVSGGVRRAISGELAILVGGDQATANRWRGLLEQMGHNVFLTGPPGSGHALKALNNLLSAVGLFAAGEVMLVGARFGLEPRLMLDVLNASTGRNNSTENKFEQFILSGTYDSGFGLGLMVKDLGIAIDLAEQTGTPCPLGERAREQWEAAASQLPVDADHTAVVRWLEQLAGSTLSGGRDPQRQDGSDRVESS